MNLHELSPAAGSNTKAYRKGRGAGSGNGKTAGRGHKGQWARSGGGVRPGFEGGRMRLSMQLPKLPGFRNPTRIEYSPVNVMRLEEVFDDGAVIDKQALVEKNIIKKVATPVKLLGDGDITKKFTIKVDKCSESAKAKVEAAGGTVELPC